MKIFISVLGIAMLSLCGVAQEKKALSKGKRLAMECVEVSTRLQTLDWDELRFGFYWGEDTDEKIRAIDIRVEQNPQNKGFDLNTVYQFDGKKEVQNRKNLLRQEIKLWSLLMVPAVRNMTRQHVRGYAPEDGGPSAVDGAIYGFVSVKKDGKEYASILESDLLERSEVDDFLSACRKATRKEE